MDEMLAIARARGLATVEGDVLPENTTMLRMVHDLGGTTRPNSDTHTVRAVFDLSGPAKG